MLHYLLLNTIISSEQHQEAINSRAVESSIAGHVKWLSPRCSSESPTFHCAPCISNYKNWITCSNLNFQSVSPLQFNKCLCAHKCIKSEIESGLYDAENTSAFIYASLKPRRTMWYLPTSSCHAYCTAKSTLKILIKRFITPKEWKCLDKGGSAVFSESELFCKFTQGCIWWSFHYSHWPIKPRRGGQLDGDEQGQRAHGAPVIMQGVTDHSCGKEADFITAQKGPESALCFR